MIRDFDMSAREKGRERLCLGKSFFVLLCLLPSIDAGLPSTRRHLCGGRKTSENHFDMRKTLDTCIAEQLIIAHFVEHQFPLHAV